MYFIVDRGYTPPTEQEMMECIKIVTQKTVEKRNKKMKVGDKEQLRRRISQKGGKTRLATEKVTILGIYPHHIQVRNQKGIVRSYINWEWQQLTSKKGMEGVESWRRKG